MPSVNMRASGYAILRDTAPEAESIPDDQSHQRYLLLKYGPHGGGHGHPDKLNLILYAFGQRLSPDLGTPGYGLDLFESWYRQTISHNTVTIDGLSQPLATGTINTFRADGAFQIADASVSWREEGELSIEHPYHDISMRRVILTRPDYFLDIVLVEAREGREAKRIDWVYHNAGAPRTNLPGQPLLITSDDGMGYQHISHAQAAPVQGDFVVHWPPVATQPLPVGLQLFVAGGIPGEAITGNAPGNPPTDLLGVLIHRRLAAATAYLSFFHPYQGAPKVTRVEWLGRNLLEEGWAGCVVHLEGRQEQWLVRMDPETLVPPLPETPQGVALFEYTLSQPS